MGVGVVEMLNVTLEVVRVNLHVEKEIHTSIAEFVLGGGNLELVLPGDVEDGGNGY